MQVRVRMNNGALHRLSAAAIKALVMTVDQLYNEAVNEGVYPFRTGELQNESTFTDDAEADRGRVRVISDTPYARRLYYHPEYNFRTDNNAGARGEWWEPWLDGDKSHRAQELYNQFFCRVSGV